MRVNLNAFLDALHPILDRKGFNRSGNFWKKETVENYVGFRLVYSVDTRSISGFFGASTKKLSETSLDDFDIGLWESQIHGDINVQVSGLNHIAYQCSSQLDNKSYDFYREYYGADPEFNEDKLEYLKSPPLDIHEKVKIFTRLFETQTIPLLHKLETLSGMKHLILDESYGFTVWHSLAMHLGILTKKQVESGCNPLGDYNYKTFVTL